MSGELRCSSSSVYGDRLIFLGQSSFPSEPKRRPNLLRVWVVTDSAKRERDDLRGILSDAHFERPGNKRRPLTDDGARRVIKKKQALDSQLRKNQPGARPARWFQRSPSQMAQFLADGRANYRFNKYVDKAIRTIAQLASARRDSFDFHTVMSPWVGSLSFKDMCIVLREQKDVFLACEFFRWMKLQASYIPSVIPYTILLRKCGEANRFDLVESYYTEMLQEGCEPDEVLICSLICIFGKSGRIDDMMLFYSMMHSQGLFPPITVINFMLSSLYKADLYGDAINVWKDLLAAHVKPNEYTFAVVVNCFRKVGKSTEALHVFEEMIQEGHLPDETLFNIVIKMMGDEGRSEKILELYERMKLQGLTLTKHTYTYLVHFFGSIGKFQMAVAFFSEMQSRGILVDEVIYGTIISIYSKMGMFTDAEEAFREMDEADLIVSDRIFVLMATVRIKAGQFDLALQILDDMQSRGFEMSRYAWVVKLQCLVKQQKSIHAATAFKTMLEKGFADAVSFTCMFNLYRKLEQSEAGDILLSELESSKVIPDRELSNAIVNYLFNAGYLQKADVYFSEMQMKGFCVNVAVKITLMRAYGKAGRVPDAVSIYQSLEQPDAMAFAVMFMVYDDAGDGEAAMVQFRRLLECDVSYSNKILSNYARRGVLDTVEDLCSQMLAKGLLPSEETLVNVVHMFTRSKQCQVALDLIEQGHKSGLHFSPKVYDVMINSCIESGQHRKAEILRQTIEKLALNKMALEVST